MSVNLMVSCLLFMKNISLVSSVIVPVKMKNMSSMNRLGLGLG